MEALKSQFLSGNIVQLVPITPKLSKALFTAYNELDEEGRFMTGTVTQIKQEHTDAYCKRVSEEENGYYYGIKLREGGEFIGETALTDIDRNSLNGNFRTCIYNERHRNNGAGTEALNLILEFGFNQVGLHRIDLTVFEHNPKAKHVYTKLGFTEEGVFRDVLKYDGQYYNGILMSILEHEFRAR